MDLKDELSKFIFTSKYARYRETDKRRETWDEAVTRLESMHLKRFAWLDNVDKKEIKTAFDFVREQKAVPSMRSLQFGGKAIEAHEARMFNCLKKETKFVTDCGVKSFEDFKSGDQINVLGHSGQWKNATVRSYGINALYPIKITRGKSIYTVWATKDHRWMLKNGTIVSSIKTGDLLRASEDIFSTWSYEDAPPDERLYWAYGYVYGDGTRVQAKDNSYKYSMVRLCGEQATLVTRFEELGFFSSRPLSCKGDVMVYTGTYLKTTPDPNIDAPRLIRSFVSGYLEADGERNRSNGNNKYLTIQCSDQDHIEFIRKCFPIAGVFIISEAELTGQQTNYGTRPYTIKFRITNAIPNTENYNVPFVVSEIGTPISEETWCLEVEDDLTFTLPNGLITGNCAVRHVDSLRAFSEIFYLLLCGNGVGIGVSKKFLKRLPDLVDANDKTGIILPYSVEDTIEGWADSVEALLGCYFRNTPFTGRKIVFDYSKIRKKGAPLKIGGGKAPGYRGLKNAHGRIKNILDNIIEENHQRRLSPINAYDALMHCADAVLSGGVRRSATSVIFDWDDTEMVEAKTFLSVKKKKQFELNKDTNKYEGFVIVEDSAYPSQDYVPVEIEEWEYEKVKNEKKISWTRVYPHRARSNNSVLLLRGQTDFENYQKIFARTKQFGEPGFVFADHPDTLYNPCFEIGFVPVSQDGISGVQFCNLTSINGAKVSSPEDFYSVARAAALIGTLQATYTHYPYLSNSAKWLTEEEALLGVSITGMMNHPEILFNPEYQRKASEVIIETNKIWAKKLGINQAARVTCVKPEGTGSIVLKAASGCHAEHADRYFRLVQMNKLDSVYRHFKKINPHMSEESVWSANKTDDVVSFPIEASVGTILKKDLNAIQHLNMVKSTQENWVNHGITEANHKPVTHNVSCTIIVGPDEWDEVTKYLYNNRSYFSAVSFLAKTGDHDFKQAPLRAISTPEDEENWYKIMKDFKPVDYTQLIEEDDHTELQQELVCAGGQCELPMLSN